MGAEGIAPAPFFCNTSQSNGILYLTGLPEYASLFSTVWLEGL